MGFLADDWSLTQLLVYTIALMTFIVGVAILGVGHWFGLVLITAGILLPVLYLSLTSQGGGIESPGRRNAIMLGTGFGLGAITVGSSGFLMGSRRGEENGYDEGFEHGHDGAWREYADPTQLRGDEILNKEASLDLQRDDHHATEINANREFLLNVIVLSQQPVDVYLLEDEEFDAYRNDGEPSYLMLGSELSTTEAVYQVEQSSGTYHLVVDNTSLEKAPPVDNTRVEIRLNAWQKSQLPPNENSVKREYGR